MQHSYRSRSIVYFIVLPSQSYFTALNIYHLNYILTLTLFWQKNNPSA